MNILSSLNKDIMNLYFSTGNKSIEDLFIKVESTSKTKTILPFEQWIEKCKVSVLQDDTQLSNDFILPRLSDENNFILPTFAQMNMLIEMYPNGISLGVVAQGMFNPSFSKFVPKIKSIGKYVNQFTNILGRYTIIFDSLNKMQIDNKDDAATLRDLQIISAKYDSYKDNLMHQNEESVNQTIVKERVRKPTKEVEKTMRGKMYEDLMNHFSPILSEEASKLGNAELSTFFSNGGIANISKLSDIVDIYSFGGYKSMGFSLDAVAKDMLKYVWEHYSANDLENNIAYIKTKSMDADNLIPFGDYYSTLQTHQRTIKKSLGQEDDGAGKVNSVINNSSLLLKMIPLSCIAMFFFSYTDKLSK